MKSSVLRHAVVYRFAVCTALSLVAVLSASSPALAGDAGISAKKLSITDFGAAASKARLSYVAKLDPGIAKGPDGSRFEIDATLDVYYSDSLGAGAARFLMLQGSAWRSNSGPAKYVNKTAPALGAIKKALIIPTRLVRLSAKALGDDSATSIDIIAAGAPSASGGVTTILSVYNRIDGSMHRMCTRFATALGSSVKFKSIAAGTGRRLIAKNGVPVDCPLDYGDDTFWLCKPGMANNQCLVNSLDATELLADNSTLPEPHNGSEDHPYDCFYVYPTVHLFDPVGNRIDLSDISLELDPLLNQAARFNGSCRIFAPLYRQITLQSFLHRDKDKFLEFAYRDVRAAFDEYMAVHNGGRNIVIIGHSQGTAMLERLVQEEFDGSALMSAKLIVALLIGGGDLYVPDGQSVGGTFQNIPLCSSPSETGCVIAYRTYAEAFPPLDGSNIIGPAGMDTACTNPAALGGGQASFAASYFTDIPNQPVFNVIANFNLGTPFIKYSGFYAGECVKDADNHSYLEIRARPGPGDLRSDDINYNHIALDPAALGTHILDYEFAIQDLINLVETKAASMP